MKDKNSRVSVALRETVSFLSVYLRECHVIPLVTSCFCALFVHLYVNFPCQQPVKAPPVLNSTPATFCSLLLLYLLLFIFIFHQYYL